MYSKKYIGSTFRTKETLGGYTLKVIAGGRKKSCCLIQIEEWIAEVRVEHIKTGNIKYPFHPVINSIGYMGVGKYSSKNIDAYVRWTKMFGRCYSKNELKVHPTYTGCTVSKEWHNFQNFAEWFYRYYPKDGKKYDLDKDIKVIGNKIYSKDTCIFVPHKINTFVANRHSNNTSGYTGVSWDKSKKKWKSAISIDGKSNLIGYYNKRDDASMSYIKKRDDISKRIRRLYSFDYPIDVLANIK